MTTVVILPHPGENAVFFEAARKLFLSELSLCAARLDAHSTHSGTLNRPMEEATTRSASTRLPFGSM